MPAFELHDARMGDPANDVEPAPRAERPRSPRMAMRRRIALACLDAPLREAVVTNGQLERWLGLNEKTIRLMRAGERPCALEDVAALPERVRALVLDALKAA